MDVLGWVLIGIVAVIVVLVLVAAILQLPEIRRYLKIRAM